MNEILLFHKLKKTNIQNYLTNSIKVLKELQGPASDASGIYQAITYKKTSF